MDIFFFFRDWTQNLNGRQIRNLFCQYTHTEIIICPYFIRTGQGFVAAPITVFDNNPLKLLSGGFYFVEEFSIGTITNQENVVSLLLIGFIEADFFNILLNH